jgi:hypothetical protein
MARRTQLVSKTLAALRDEGYVAEVVERYNHYSKRRIDYIGVGDILAFKANPPDTLLVQVTDMDHRTAHLEKILAEPLARVWIRAGNRLEQWTWRKLKVKRGGKAVRWTAKREEPL